MLTKAAFVLKQLYCEIFQFKIDVCYLNIFENVIYSLDREFFFYYQCQKTVVYTYMCVCVYYKCRKQLLFSISVETCFCFQDSLMNKKGK